MHSSRMRATRSSSHLLGGICLSACWDTSWAWRPPTPVQTPNLPQVWAWRPPWVWVWRPPWPDPQPPPRCGPGDPPGQTPKPPPSLSLMYNVCVDLSSGGST